VNDGAGVSCLSRLDGTLEEIANIDVNICILGIMMMMSWKAME